MKRKSVSLSKGVRGDILHRFFMDITKEPRDRLKMVENDAAQKVYDIIYGKIAPVIDEMPDEMLTFHTGIPLPSVDVKAKKKARVKGSIEPTKTERFQFRTFSNWMNLDRTAVTLSVDELRLSSTEAQYSCNTGISRCSHYHINRLVEKKMISRTDAKCIETVYIKACKDARKLYIPIVEIMDGVIEILKSVKSTKGLIEAWPGCEKYLSLPEELSGALIKVDVAKLDKALDGLYPPAENSGGA